MIKFSYIKKLPNGNYRVFSENGKNMGTFDSKEKAKQRLKQIEFFKHKKAYKIIDLSDINDFSLSAVVRKLRKEVSPEIILEFLKIYKCNFDSAIKNDLQKPDTVSLSKALIEFNKKHPVKLNKEMVKEAAITELGTPEIVGQYLASIIKFLLMKISQENRPKSLYNLKQKIYHLNEHAISSKKMPASSAIGQAITLVKHMLFNHDAHYVRNVLNNIVKNL